jgi:PAS domain-containing protein
LTIEEQAGITPSTTAPGPAAPGVRLAQALETMPNGFIAVDAGFHITAINAEGESVLGIERDQLHGRDFFDVFPAAQGSAFGTAVSRSPP